MVGLIKKEDLTVSSLGFIFVSSISWSGARAVCNSDPPKGTVKDQTKTQEESAPSIQRTEKREVLSDGSSTPPALLTPQKKQSPSHLPPAQLWHSGSVPFFASPQWVHPPKSLRVETHSFLHWVNANREVVSCPHPLASLLQIQRSGTLLGLSTPFIKQM